MRPSKTAPRPKTAPRRVFSRWRAIVPRTLAARIAAERGAATAEYAIVIMAAVGFAGLLVVIMRSDEVRGILADLIQSALTFAG